jgi:hypothetical protein
MLQPVRSRSKSISMRPFCANHCRECFQMRGSKSQLNTQYEEIITEQLVPRKRMWILKIFYLVCQNTHTHTFSGSQQAILRIRVIILHTTQPSPDHFDVPVPDRKQGTNWHVYRRAVTARTTSWRYTEAVTLYPSKFQLIAVHRRSQPNYRSF